MSMHIPESEARKLAESDAQQYGTGFYRKRANGLAEHIPANSVVVIAAQQQAEQYCKRCGGEGVIHTGIAEASSTQCRACNGTGLEQQAEPGADERKSLRDKWKIVDGDCREGANGLITHHVTAFDEGWQARAAQSGQRAGVSETAAARDVLAERQRQVSAEGWTPEHDDEHGGGEMVEAAICYAQGYKVWHPSGTYQRWPWALKWWKPTNRRRDLIKAGALILAEIERIDRRVAAPTQQQEGGK